MSKFIQLTCIPAGPFYLNIENVESVSMYEGKTCIRGKSMRGSEGYHVTETVEEVMALINGKRARLELPEVSPKDVIVDRSYWVYEKEGDSPHIFHARKGRKFRDGDSTIWFFNSSYGGEPIYKADCGEVTAIYGPIPYPSELSSEVRP